jgi:hypothetical protein
MLYFHTKNFQTKTPILIFFVSPRRRKFWSFLPFGTFYGQLVYFVAFWEYFVVFWYIFPGFSMLYQEKSGNPVVTYFGKTRQQK